MGCITNIYPKSGLYQLITGSEPINHLQYLIRRDMEIIINACCKNKTIFPIENKDAQNDLMRAVKSIIKKHQINTLNEGNDYTQLMYNSIVIRIQYHNLIKCS